VGAYKGLAPCGKWAAVDWSSPANVGSDATPASKPSVARA